MATGTEWIPEIDNQPERKNPSLGLLRFWEVLPFLLLLPILTFPAGPDQSIYGVSGKMLMEGMTYYTEVGDLKPPFIHFLFGAANALLGDGILAPRIVELLAQWVTLFFILKITRRFVADRWTPAIAAMTYALLYVGLGPDGTNQPESYIGLLLLPGMLLLLGTPTTSRYVGAGVLASMLAIVKYSMIVCPILFILSPFLLPLKGTERWQERGRAALLIALGAIPPILLAYWYLQQSEAIVGFLQANQYLSARLKLVVQQGGIGARLETLGLWFGYSFGITMSCLLAIGVWQSTITTPRRNNAQHAPINIDPRFYSFTALIVATLFASTVVELLMFPYQFSRFYAPASILVAASLRHQQFLGRLATIWRERSLSGVVVAGCLLVVAIAFSAAPRYLLEVARGVAWRTSAEAASNRWFHADGQAQRELCELGDTILARNPNRAVDLVAISGFACYLYCYTNITPTFRHLHSHSLIAPFTPEAWKQDLVNYIKHHSPEFIAVERNDEGAAQFAGASSTDSAIAAIPQMQQLLQQNYDTLHAWPSVILYQSQANQPFK